MSKSEQNASAYARQLALVKDPRTSVNTFKNMYWGYFTEEMCLAAVKTNLTNYNSIPQKRLTPKVCKYYLEEQLKLNPKFFKELPQTEKPKVLCFEMFKLDEFSFEYIPLYGQNQAMCIAVFTKNSCKLGLKRLHPLYRTYELCEIAVARDGLQLEHVAINDIDAELCHTAMTNNPHAFQHVPLHLQTLDYALAAVKVGFAPKDGNVRADLLPQIQATRMAYQVRRDEADYQIPESKRHRQAPLLDGVAWLEYKSMVEMSGINLGKVPPRHRNQELCELAVLSKIAGTPLAYRHVPAIHRTIEFMQKALAIYPDLHLYYARGLMTFKEMKAAVDKNPSVWKDTPPNLLGRITRYVANTYPDYL